MTHYDFLNYDGHVINILLQGEDLQFIVLDRKFLKRLTRYGMAILQEMDVVKNDVVKEGSSLDAIVSCHHLMEFISLYWKTKPLLSKRDGYIILSALMACLMVAGYDETLADVRGIVLNVKSGDEHSGIHVYEKMEDFKAHMEFINERTENEN